MDGDTQYDTSEGDELAGRASAHLRQLTIRCEEIERDWHSGPPAPTPGSRLFEADQLNSYEHVSQHIHNFIVLGIDNLRTTTRYVDAHLELPLIGLYSMIRASIEASSNGLWMLRAGTKNKLAWRGLQRTYVTHEDYGSLERALGAGQEEQAVRHSGLRRRLLEIQQGIPSYRQNNIAGLPKMTQVVQEADKSVPHRFTVTGLQAWKMCSGMAHGNFAIQRVIWEHVLDGEGADQGEMLRFEFRSRISVVASFAQVALENLEALIPLYRDACTPRQSSRIRTGG